MELSKSMGSIDGKHIKVNCPANSGSMYFNYKKYFSTVLMTIDNASYRFLIIDVGAYGKDSDGSVIVNSKFYQRIENGSFKLPFTIKLPNSDISAPFVSIGDKASPLKNYLMRPFPRNNVKKTKNRITTTDMHVHELVSSVHLV